MLTRTMGQNSRPRYAEGASIRVVAMLASSLGKRRGRVIRTAITREEVPANRSGSAPPSRPRAAAASVKRSTILGKSTLLVTWSLAIGPLFNVRTTPIKTLTRSHSSRSFAVSKSK